MKKIKIIMLVFVAIVLIAAIAIGIWQRDNVKSIIDSQRYTTDEIKEKIQKNQKKMEKIVKETDYIDIRSGLDEDEEKALERGLITIDDAKLLVKGQTTLDELLGKETESDANNNDPTNEKPVSPNPSNPTDPQTTPNQDNNSDELTDNVSDIVAELYVKKSEFLSKLDELVDESYHEFIAANRDVSIIPGIIERYSSVAAEYESQCDQQMNELLSKLETELKANNKDTALVNEIRQYYYTEKGLKKSYYINRITNLSKTGGEQK